MLATALATDSQPLGSAACSGASRARLVAPRSGSRCGRLTLAAVVVAVVLPVVAGESPMAERAAVLRSPARSRRAA